MITRKRSKLKKEIKKILKELEVESKWSTHSELADYILYEIDGKI